MPNGRRRSIARQISGEALRLMMVVLSESERKQPTTRMMRGHLVPPLTRTSRPPAAMHDAAPLLPLPQSLAANPATRTRIGARRESGHAAPAAVKQVEA